VLLDLVLVYGMMVYQDYAITTSGGVDNIATLCQKRNILLPTWAPPCCLLPFLTNHSITTMTIKSITGFNAVLGSLKLTLIIFYIIYFLTICKLASIENILGIISVPITIISIYCFTMFNIIMEDIMAGKNTRLLGTFLLIEYVLFDSQRGFFQLFTGKNRIGIGPSGVCALPLGIAAEGSGHYIWYYFSSPPQTFLPEGVVLGL
jgi:hypothetical protein